MSRVLEQARRFHFVGIGGIGMSGIAELLLNLGYEVSGSDMHRTDITSRLQSLGARVAEGHHARNLGDAEVLVYSSAVKASNAEVAAARKRGIPVIPRADLLAELMQLRRGIAVAGAHGKTTTTSMIAVVLDGAGLDPTAVIGGQLSVFGSNAKLGKGKYLVAEADESDRSFLRLQPEIAVITNIDQEHMDAYRDFTDLQAAFVEFANRVPPAGAAVICLDDPYVKKLKPSITARTITYGLGPGADIRAVNVELKGFGSIFTVTGSGEVRLSVPGRHNVLNALAAISVGRELGVAWPDMARGLSSFQGVERRFQKRGEANGVTVIEDYGHHPTEIAAAISAARPIAKRQLIVAFQPHRYSRTQALMNEFGPAFSGADDLVLADIYSASEDAIPGVSLDALASAVRKTFDGNLQIVPAIADVPRELSRIAKPGDVILLLGAGSIGQIWKQVLAELRESTRH